MKSKKSKRGDLIIDVSDEYKSFEKWLRRNKWRMLNRAKDEEGLTMIAWCSWCAGRTYKP